MIALIKYLRLSAEEKRLFHTAIRVAIWFRFISLIKPSNKLPNLLGMAHAETPFDVNANNEIIISKVFRAMRRSSVYLPFKEKCLVDALVVKKMLKKFNIDTTVYLGVAKDGNKKLKAHAWLRYGNNIIVGKKGMDKYVAVEWFS